MKKEFIGEAEKRNLGNLVKCRKGRLTSHRSNGKKVFYR